MNILINSSNTKGGGGVQVTDSICCQLIHFPQHQFVVVLSSYYKKTKDRISAYENVKVVVYDIQNNLSTLLFGRDRILDGLVEHNHIDAVLTVFGPSRWHPRCPHLCGFARAHLVLPESPFFNHVSLKDKMRYRIWTHYFRKSSKIFYTENPFITERFQKLMGKRVKVYTVTNFYNQIYDYPESWRRNYKLPSFEGISLLTISSWNEHKNFPIMVEICRYMEKKYPGFRYRFVLTIPAEKASFIPDNLRCHFLILGPVDVSECPFLYEQTDIMFMPSLLESFSATYPEAMRMERPIVTTDLEFARGLCGNAACYYKATSAESAADAIYRVATDKEYALRLVKLGKNQLQLFDNYNQRAEKLIGLLEDLVMNH